MAQGRYIVTGHITNGPAIGEVVDWDEEAAAQIPWALQRVRTADTASPQVVGEGDGPSTADQVVEPDAGGEEETLDVDAMTVAQLREELSERGLSTSGKKSELAERLQDAMVVEPDAGGEEE